LHSLTRKVVSRPGLVEFRLVAIGEDGATPLPALPLPLAALPAADGYLVIPAGSEGFAAGEAVSVYPLP
jgi:molybdopterin biosynthesis enzyme